MNATYNLPNGFIDFIVNLELPFFILLASGLPIIRLAAHVAFIALDNWPAHREYVVIVDATSYTITIVVLCKNKSLSGQH